MRSDVCIIGAGAAGLFASIFAAEGGAKTVVVEHNTSACRKLLRTGGGRCNLTHAYSVDDLVRSYGRFGRFLRHSLHEYSAEDLRAYFKDNGLDTRVEKDSCVFPVTDRASDVAEVLVGHAKRLSVNILYGKEVESIAKDEGDFAVTTEGQKISARAVIIATGGVTWPVTGSRGDGYKFAKELGHRVTEARASLTALITAESWPGELSGISIPHVVIRGKRGKQKFCSSGALMFTGNGISGPAVLDLSMLITDLLPNSDNPVKIAIDMIPELSFERLDKEIISLCSQNRKKDLIGAISGLFPRSLLSKLIGQINPSQKISADTVTKKQRRQLVNMLKELPLSIVSTGPIDEATVTRGGVCTSEINPMTMESKLCPGLFFAGEVIDADGPCGGFNLQIAFSTGHLAGKTAAKTMSPDIA